MYRTLLAAVALAVSSVTASAETITVCASGCDYTSINAAIGDASDGDVIQLAAETYFEGEQIDTLGKAITLRGVLDKAGQPASVLDGAGAHRVLICQSGETNATVFQFLSIENGRRDTSANTDSGGGMINIDSSPLLEVCKFVNNEVEYRGGGMYNRRSSPVLNDCAFVGNRAGTGGLVLRGGGGMCNSFSAPSLVNCVFEGNWSAKGAGVANYDSSTPTLENCVFEGNDGSGMHNEESSPVLAGCAFMFNTGIFSGGGMVNTFSSDPELVACLFIGNSASRRGGGMVNSASSSPTLVNCTFTSNSSGGDGGGMFNSSESTPYMEMCTFSNNVATNNGGGMWSAVNPGPSKEGDPTLVSCAFVSNAGYRGGGIYISSGNLLNCTFEGNSAYQTGGGIHCDQPNILALTGCTFENNHTTVGGGGGFFFVSNSGASGAAALAGCTFIENSADADGGGVSNFGSNLELDDCVFQGNMTGRRGGGIFNAVSSRPGIANCTMCGNDAGQIYGGYEDLGGNCLAYSCDDAAGDGSPDECSGDTGSTYLVPSKYASIEDAVEVAAYGGVVLVAAGTYSPARTINPGGKPITIRGELDAEGRAVTIIDGGGEIRVLECSSGEGSETVFENLVVQNGMGRQADDGSSEPTTVAGGMFNYGSSPVLKNCTFASNSADHGGGMLNYGSSPFMVACSFSGNTADRGGAMYNDEGSGPYLINVAFTDNDARYRGGGLYENFSSISVLEQCTFMGNSSEYFGGGVYSGGGSPRLASCLVFDNFAGLEGGGIYNASSGSSVPILSGCKVCGNGSGEIYGGYEDLGGNCVTASCEDPTDLDRNGITDGSDLGLFFVYWGECRVEDCPADFNADGIVDGIDLGILFSAWGPCQ